MNIKQVLDIKHGKPVAWMVFLKDNGKHVDTIYATKMADRYLQTYNNSSAAPFYDIIPLTR